jgi:uncharacterized membrane protein
MKKYFAILFFLLLLCFIPQSVVFGQERVGPVSQQEGFYKGTVLKVEKDEKERLGKMDNPHQVVSVRLSDGPEAGKNFRLEYGGMFIISAAQRLHSGDTVILRKNINVQTKKSSYVIVDKYRLDTVLSITAAFLLVVLLISRRKGLGAIVGMIISLLIIFFFIVPQIINGHDPLLISIVGSLVIMVITIYLAHGFNQQTSVAVVSTFLCLVLTGVFAIIFVHLAKLTGLGTEDEYSLLQGFNNTINLQGLLLGGIIIGALGVLDDVTTTQVATVYTLADANPKYTIMDLFQKGMLVGREHISSLVNTLVLAYAGASITIFIFLHLGINSHVQPLWVMLNSELITEEIIRTLAGSLGLILAVPVTTILAAFFARYSLKIR